MRPATATIVAMAAALGATMPGLDGSSRKVLHRPFTDADQERIDAAEAKRVRKNTRRIIEARARENRARATT